jgi:predicted RNA binding protein YcfA (HicA-like mRNA interferase family)
MPRIRSLSGQDLLWIFGQFGFSKVSQRGSHVKLRRQTSAGRQMLTIVLHQEIDKGTLHAIFRQALRFIPEVQLKPHFFTD